MPVTNEQDRAQLDYLSRSWEQKQIIRDELCRRAHADRTTAIRAALGALLLRPWQAAIFASDAARLVGGGLVALVARWWHAQANRRERQRAMDALHAMSDRELRDLGLPRSEIDWATRHGRPERSKPARIKAARASIIPTATPRPDSKSGRETEINQTKRAA